MEDEKTIPEPIPFPQKEAEPFQASRDFIAAMNAENESYSREGLKPEIRPRSPVFGTLGVNPVGPGDVIDTPEPVDWLPATGADPIEFLIDRVNRVIEETPQMGTEPLSTKASVLGALYQAQALREIADLLDELTGVTEDGKRYIRTMRVYGGQARSQRMHPQDIPTGGWQG